MLISCNSTDYSNSYNKLVPKLSTYPQILKNVPDARDHVVQELGTFGVAEQRSADGGELNKTRQRKGRQGGRQRGVEIKEKLQRGRVEKCRTPRRRDLNGEHVVRAVVDRSPDEVERQAVQRELEEMVHQRVLKKSWQKRKLVDCEFRSNTLVSEFRNMIG